MQAWSCLIAVFMRACRFVLIYFCIHKSLFLFFALFLLLWGVCIWHSFPLPGPFLNKEIIFFCYHSLEDFFQTVKSVLYS